MFLIASGPEDGIAGTICAGEKGLVEKMLLAFQRNGEKKIGMSISGGEQGVLPHSLLNGAGGDPFLPPSSDTRLRVQVRVDTLGSSTLP